MYLLDTDICIYIIKKKTPGLLTALKKKSDMGIHISSITVAELQYGAEKSARPQKNRVALLEFLTPFTILNFDDSDAVHYGIIRQKLESKGKPIGPLDMLIASQAVSRDFTLVTNNTGEFKRIDGLKVENWTED